MTFNQAGGFDSGVFVFKYIYGIARRLDKKQDTSWMNVRFNKYLMFDRTIIPVLTIELVQLLDWIKDNYGTHGEGGLEEDEHDVDHWSQSPAETK